MRPDNRRYNCELKQTEGRPCLWEVNLLALKAGHGIAFCSGCTRFESCQLERLRITIVLKAFFTSAFAWRHLNLTKNHNNLGTSSCVTIEKSGNGSSGCKLDLAM